MQNRNFTFKLEGFSDLSPVNFQPRAAVKQGTKQKQKEYNVSLPNSPNFPAIKREKIPNQIDKFQLF
jgi:hypothetical protein